MAKSLFPYVAEDGLMGFKDFNGNVRIAAQWDEVKSFGFTTGFMSSVADDDNAPARVRKGSKWGLISKLGDYLLPCEYDLISFGEYDNHIFFDLYNRYYVEGMGMEEQGLADIKGKLLFPPSKDHFYTIRDGVALFTEGYGGKITKTIDLYSGQGCPGHIKKYKKSRPSIENESRVRNGCLVDEEGNVLTERFDHISRFYYNRAYVQLKSRSGVIDEKGNFIVPLTSKLKRITTFQPGYAECEVKTKEGFVPGMIDLWGGVKVLGY